MVKLCFKVIVQKDFNTVWEYFSQFLNITQWDPNTIGCEVIKQQPGKIGSKYSVISVFKNEQFKMIYETQNFMRTEDQGMIKFCGENDLTKAQDQLICKKIQDNETYIIYKADICPKRQQVLNSPLLIPSLNELAEKARLGCIKKATQLWGKAQ